MRDNIEAVLVLIVFVWVIPMIVEFVLHRRRAKAEALAAATSETTAASAAARRADRYQAPGRRPTGPCHDREGAGP